LTVSHSKLQDFWRAELCCFKFSFSQLDFANTTSAIPHYPVSDSYLEVHVILEIR